MYSWTSSSFVSVCLRRAACPIPSASASHPSPVPVEMRTLTASAAWVSFTSSSATVALSLDFCLKSDQVVEIETLANYPTRLESDQPDKDREWVVNYC